VRRELAISKESVSETVRRHKQVLKTENLGKRIAFLENEHSKSFAKWLRKESSAETSLDLPANNGFPSSFSSVSSLSGGIPIVSMDL
nr:hypothetical protein [Tanacetum cinerariifolium]